MAELVIGGSQYPVMGGQELAFSLGCYVSEPELLPLGCFGFSGAGFSCLLAAAVLGWVQDCKPTCCHSRAGSVGW